MTDDRWKIVDEWFSRALDVPVDDRAAWLDEVASRDPALRIDIERLLRLEERAAGFLARRETPTQGHAVVGEAATATVQFGPYRVVRSIGAGGMGEVYLAERNDGEFEQRVAVKQVAYPTPGLLRRFQRERQILARLEHPHIARLVDGGLDAAGAPFLVMEYVDGSPITGYATAKSLDVPARVRLFVKVCDAVQYAHQNLVVHRDLKPSNIFVTNDGIPKLLDFGIAKVLAATDDGATHTASRVMTPRYAAPEQFTGGAITTATDVYSLGVVLYELLAGRPPSIPAQSAEARWPGGNAQPLPPPSMAVDLTLEHPAARRRILRGDLDRIVSTALAHDPQRRYASAEALAADLTRYLEGRPIAARSDSVGYVLRKFVARNRAAVAVAALLVLATGVGICGVLWEARQAHLQALRAEAEARTATAVKNFLIGIFNAAGPDEALGQKASATDLLDAGSKRLDTALRDEPRVRAELFAAVGTIDVKLGLYAVARDMSRRGLDVARVVADAEDPVVLELELNLANSLDGSTTDADDGEATNEAIRSLDHVIATEQRMTPERQNLLVAALDVRGRVMMNRGDFVHSESDLREAIAVARARGPGAVSELSEAQTSLALSLAHAARFVEAIAVYREALQTRERSVDARDPGLLELRCSLADTLQTIGQTAEAEAILRDVLAKERDVVGESHPLYATALNTLLNNLIMTHKFPEAEHVLREGDPIWNKLYAPDSEDAFEVLNSTALLKYEEGDYVAATQAESRGLVIAEKLHGPEHPDTIATRHNLALYEFRSGDLDDAQRDFERTLQLRRKTHQETAGALNFLGNLARLRGRPDEARHLHEEALVDAVQRESSSGITAIEAHLALAQDDRNLDQRSQARAEARAATDAVPAADVTDSPFIENADLVVSELDYLDGHCDRAIPTLERLRPLGDSARKYWRGAEVDLLLGLCERKVGGRFDPDADALLARSVSEFKTIPVVDPFMSALLLQVAPRDVRASRRLEREVTGERIRDKIAASKKKGMWMGGLVPLGYDPDGRTLKVNPAEAEQVRETFRRYLELGSVARLRDALQTEGVRSKRRSTASGSAYGGCGLTSGAVLRILTNPIYRGEIAHRDQRHPGQHEAIVPEDLWNAVQALRERTRRANSTLPKAQAKHPLLGLLSDEQGRRYTAVHTTKGHRRYRYYVAKSSEAGAPATRYPADELELHVSRRLQAFFNRPKAVVDAVLGPDDSSTALQSALRQATALEARKGESRWEAWRPPLAVITLGDDAVSIKIDVHALRSVLGLPMADATEATIDLVQPMRLQRTAHEIRLVIPTETDADEAGQRNESLIRFIARGRRWYRQITSGEMPSIQAIAKAEKVTERYVARVLRGSLLAPDLMQRILDGRQPVGLTVRQLLDPPPIDWVEQRRHFGLDPA